MNESKYICMEVQNDLFHRRYLWRLYEIVKRQLHERGGDLNALKSKYLPELEEGYRFVTVGEDFV